MIFLRVNLFIKKSYVCSQYLHPFELYMIYIHCEDKYAVVIEDIEEIFVTKVMNVIMNN